MLKHALYYPYIDFRNANWIKAMAMFYENIYRIVPDGLIPNDPEELQPLLEDGSVGAMINPIPYSQETSDVFLEKADEWSASALVSSEEGEIKFSRLHTDKTDKAVRELFQSLGYEENQGWLHIPTELASNYMLFLATEISKKNQLCLITSEWAPWTATSYFNLDGKIDEDIMPYGYEDGAEDPFALFCLIVNEMTPINIAEIAPHHIFKFREKRKDEISNFRRSIFNLYQELQLIEDPQIRADNIYAKIDEFKKAETEYKKSADIIKAKGWFSFSFMGFPAPIALGNLFNIPFASTAILAGTALAIGGLFNIKTLRWN